MSKKDEYIATLNRDLAACRHRSDRCYAEWKAALHELEGTRQWLEDVRLGLVAIRDDVNEAMDQWWRNGYRDGVQAQRAYTRRWLKEAIQSIDQTAGAEQAEVVDAAPHLAQRLEALAAAFDDSSTEEVSV